MYSEASGRPAAPLPSGWLEDLIFVFFFGRDLDFWISPLKKMCICVYPCVEFGRLGCTSFIFTKVVPYHVTFWLKCHMIQKWHLFSVRNSWVSTERCVVVWLRQSTQMSRFFTQLRCKTFYRGSESSLQKGTWQLQKGFGRACMRWCTCQPLTCQSRNLRSSHLCGGCHAAWPIVSAAPTTWGAIDFHGWAIGHDNLPWYELEPPLSKPGSTTTRTRLRLISWRWSDWRQDIASRTLSRVNGTNWWRGALTPLVVPRWPTYIGHSVDGNVDTNFGVTPECMCQTEVMPKGAQGADHRGPWRHGWNSWWWMTSTTCQRHVRLVEDPPGGFVAAASWGSVSTAMKLEMKRSVVKKDVRWKLKADSSCQQFVVVRPLGDSFDGSFACMRQHELNHLPRTREDSGDPVAATLVRQGGQQLLGLVKAMIVMMGAGLLGNKVTPTLQCAGDGASDDPWPGASGASSSSRGPQASVGPARWAATTSLELAARERVLMWRGAQGLEDDSDFAFRWASHEEAAAGAGHAVAHEWLRVRAEQRDALLPAVARVMEEIPKPTPSQAPTILREMVSTKGKTMFGKKRKGVRLRANVSDAPEAVCQRVEALTKVMMKFGALAPSGNMNASLHEEWRQSCFRLSQRLVTQAESTTVLNALKTAEELQVFMRDRERSCLPEKVDIDAYLHAATTPAPVRALASLKWLSNNGQLGWSLQDLAAPSGPRRKRTRGGSAIVIAPPMLAFTEETIERMQRSGNERWTALLGCWLVAVGCLRYRHIARASPKRISMSTVHCFCWRGKQRAHRSGFHFAVPSEFSSGFPWAQHWMELYGTLKERQQQGSGLCFDRTGAPWTIGEVVRVAQEVFSPTMDDVSQLTTYSFRRWAPTYGQLLSLTPMELNALGDWQARGETPRDAVMPLHYSSARYSESMKMKHLLLLCAPAVCEFEAWEVIPPSILREAKAKGRHDLDRQIHRDIQNVWTQPLTPGEAMSKFKLSKAMLSKAAALKAKGAKAMEARAMPATLGNKVLSAFLKNGQPLCGAFQIGRCSKSEDQCDALHKCAVVLRSARVCGGRHSAADCHDKRALPIDGPPSQQQQDVVEQPPAEGRPQMVAASKKRPKSPEGPPPKKRTKLPIKTDNNAAEEALYDRLATSKGKTAQRPTCISEHSSGGQVWLSGLPTPGTLPAFPAVTMQIVCFSEKLEKRGGCACPGAQVWTMAVTDKDKRDEQWKRMWPVLRSSYQSGEAILIHCMAGRHRAAGVSILVKSLLEDRSIEESDSLISAKRDIEFDHLTRTQHVAEWIWYTFRHTSLGPSMPRLQGFMATERSQLHIRTENDVTLCCHKQKSDRAAERLRAPMRTMSLQEAVAWGRPWCETCISKAPAGVQTQIRDCWEEKCEACSFWGKGGTLPWSNHFSNGGGNPRVTGMLCDHMGFSPPYSFPCSRRSFQISVLWIISSVHRSAPWVVPGCCMGPWCEQSLGGVTLGLDGL